jgi:tRNA-2-methylthio-N6-dimethylallyladenosine synthase
MNVYLETLGCQMNRLDSERVRELLREAGHALTDDPAAAEIVLYNTCSVREHAEDKVFGRLGIDRQRKRDGRLRIVAVIGCMAQRLGGELIRRYPQVDVVCGPGRLPQLPELLEAAMAGESVVALDPDRKSPREDDAEAAMDRLDLSRHAGGEGGVSAFVRVMRGCDKFCTYCIVPYVRGPERSREPEQIRQEVRRLVDSGVSEVTLLGQTVNSYRWAAGERTVRFSDLLERLSGVCGLRRLRFVTSHPVDFGDDILRAVRDLPNVCEFLHCPPQSGSDAVLKRMNRGYDRRDYDAFVDRCGEIVPEAALVGDFITGFPGESEADHAASMDLIRRSGFKNSYVFKYSPRPGTSGERRLADDVPEAVKKRRNNELLDVQKQVGLEHHRRYLGRTLEVLVSGPSPRSDRQGRPDPPGCVQLTGRSRGDHIVVFYGPPELANRYVNVHIAGCDPLNLFGETIPVAATGA